MGQGFDLSRVLNKGLLNNGLPLSAAVHLIPNKVIVVHNFRRFIFSFDINQRHQHQSHDDGHFNRICTYTLSLAVTAFSELCVFSLSKVGQLTFM